MMTRRAYEKISDIEQLRYRGGSNFTGTHLPASDSQRDCSATTGSATTIVHSFASPSSSGTRFSYTVEVIASRTDTFGDASYFIVRGLYKTDPTTGVVSTWGSATPEVLVGEPTDTTHIDGSAGTWRCTLSTGTNGVVNVSVNGESGKTITWSVLRETFEAVP